LLALCGAAIYGELGTMLPRTGGEYVYLREAFHESVGFLSGWLSLIVGFAAPVAVSAIAFGKYVHWVVPNVSNKLAATAIILLLTTMHTASVIIGARVQTAFSILKVSLILMFVRAAVMVGKGDWSNLTAGQGVDKVAGGAFAVFLYWIAFSYSGWNAAAYIAGEIRDPGRNLPRALLLGSAIVTALYLLQHPFAECPLNRALVDLEVRSAGQAHWIHPGDLRRHRRDRRIRAAGQTPPRRAPLPRHWLPGHPHSVRQPVRMDGLLRHQARAKSRPVGRHHAGERRPGLRSVALGQSARGMNLEPGEEKTRQSRPRERVVAQRALGSVLR
jgi:hypothetical protein